MIEITDSARAELHRMMGGYDFEEGQGFRLATPPVWEGQGDFGIVIDVGRDRDHVVEYEGVVVLRLDPGTTEHLAKAVMDFKESRFTLDVY